VKKNAKYWWVKARCTTARRSLQGKSWLSGSANQLFLESGITDYHQQKSGNATIRKQFQFKYLSKTLIA
jgi:hypothetical protein